MEFCSFGEGAGWSRPSRLKAKSQKNSWGECSVWEEEKLLEVMNT